MDERSPCMWLHQVIGFQAVQSNIEEVIRDATDALNSKSRWGLTVLVAYTAAKPEMWLSLSDLPSLTVFGISELLNLLPSLKGEMKSRDGLELVFLSFWLLARCVISISTRKVWGESECVDEGAAERNQDTGRWYASEEVIHRMKQPAMALITTIE